MGFGESPSPWAYSLTLERLVGLISRPKPAPITHFQVFAEITSKASTRQATLGSAAPKKNGPTCRVGPIAKEKLYVRDVARILVLWGEDMQRLGSCHLCVRFVEFI